MGPETVETASHAALAINIAAQLEPLAGAALAINVAYLGLVRFRYRDQIRDGARVELRIFEPSDKPAPANIKSMKMYKQLCELCALSNHDLVDVPHAIKDARINGGFWSQIYHYLYRKHNDRNITYFSSVAAGTTLIAGVARNIDTWGFMDYIYNPWSGPIWMYLLILFSVLPVAMVYGGRKIVFYALEHAREYREEIEKAMQTGSQLAQLPDASPNVVPMSVPNN
ncbi:hypothetical protein [Mesorhizobium sp. M0520]|uniref:hypothetical protein n=1 Tax=unclassified Mesorhizobium TaxID=325217 RepID=UPI003338EC06